MGALAAPRAHAQNSLWLRRVVAGHDESAPKTLLSILRVSLQPTSLFLHTDALRSLRIA